MNLAGVVLLVLTIICGLAALAFLVRGMVARSAQSSRPYQVAKQEARHDMQIDFLRAGFLFILTLILLGIYGLVPGEGQASSVATATATVAPSETLGVPTMAATAVPEREETPSVEATAIEMTATISPTITSTPVVTPTEETATPDMATAVVNSPNGLWLREAPGGSQEIELIAHETVLELLDGRETDEDIEWQRVRTPAGNEGWVAAEYLVNR